MRASALLLVAAAVALAGPPLVLAYREGPLPAMTGGFGERTCASCHFDNRVNDPAGSLRVEGAPASYAGGREYAITIAVERPAIKRAGFELSVRFADGAEKGRQAGTLRAPDARTQIVSAPDASIKYIQHTKLGSDLSGTAVGRWTIYWTAPSPGAGRVIFHVAGNAANDDASPLGDFIYTATRASRPAQR